MTQYSLTCINNSQLLGSFVVFQQPQPSEPGNLLALAWLARPVHPQTQATFEWSRDYNFVWSQTGNLAPGIAFSASEVMAADPKQQNLVELTVDQFGAPYFANPSGNGSPGMLTIRQLAGIVPNQISVGIGMAGAATFVVQAAPNMTAVFTPHSSCWVAFGEFQQGQVLDLEQISNAQEVAYSGTTSRTATLGPDGRITIS